MEIKTKNLKISETTIYIDLDGVIVDLNQPIIDILGVDTSDKKIRQEIKKDNGFMGSVCPEKRWRQIKNRKELWENPIITEVGQKLLDNVSKTFKNFYILSSPSDIPIAAYEKVKLMNKLGLNKRYILTPAKYLLATPNSILIDDMSKNINKFRDNGGKVLLFPCLFKFEDGDVSFDDVWNEIISLSSDR